MENFEVGDSVKFLGCTKEQVEWGSNDNPNELLFVGNNYYVEHVDVHSMHTKLTLCGVSGRFNSVCFEKV